MRRAQRRALLGKRLGLVVRGDDPGGAQNCLPQPPHSEEQQQNADRELHVMDRHARDQRTESEHEGREESEPRQRSGERGPPSAHRAHREHDGERFHRLDKRS